jgi:hypothetical protein
VETLTLVLQVEAANAALADRLTDLLQRQLEYSLDDTVADSEAVPPGSPWAARFVLVTVFPPDMAVHFAQTLHVWLVRNPSARLIISFGGAVSSTTSAGYVLKVVERALAKRPHSVPDV